jgi:hypothetical protein
MLQDQQTQAFAHGKYFLNILSKAHETRMYDPRNPKIALAVAYYKLKLTAFPMQPNPESHHLGCC